jgi:hypothetical protein
MAYQQNIYLFRSNRTLTPNGEQKAITQQIILWRIMP